MRWLSILIDPGGCLRVAFYILPNKHAYVSYVFQFWGELLNDAVNKINERKTSDFQHLIC
jgi:hypothetical protein